MLSIRRIWNWGDGFGKCGRLRVSPKLLGLDFGVTRAASVRLSLFHNIYFPTRGRRGGRRERQRERAVFLLISFLPTSWQENRSIELRKVESPSRYIEWQRGNLLERKIDLIFHSSP